MKKYRAREARKLREFIAHMLFAHILFAFLEIFVYNFLVLTFATELVFMWVCYYSYMTLNKCACCVYICLMFTAPVSGIMGIFNVGKGIKPFLYLGQLCIYGYCGGFLLLNHMLRWTRAKSQAEQMSKQNS